ncbi:unnamed protein product [Thelazia callipaeda]|uniref:PDZ domain-containing protein n=1 Tax=Thelazia callipaeda TaxID=103827 RepID=A0A0N5CZ09_THECL|nr:unnamed protein product [Thelazia callipaeda]
MASLLTLCVSTHCCRNTKKNENPYGEIIGTSTADAPIPMIVSRNKSNGSRPNRSSRLSCPNLSPHERSTHRLSAPLPQSAVSMNRALPKLPESSRRLENENVRAIYSTIDRCTLINNRDNLLLYGEGPANPTYECIDAVPSYSKLENGGRSTKRYDYPMFALNNCKVVTADDVLYQNASQIYTGVSEDTYSSIAGGEANYDVGYSHVSQPTNTCLTNSQTTNPSLDHLYTRIRRGPSTNRASNPSTSRPMPSNDPTSEYISSGSDKTSREPSYRYITVRESVDAIRQRLCEFNNTLSQDHSVFVEGDGCERVREHYYSSIGGDYETLQVSSAPINQSVVYPNIRSTSSAHEDLESLLVSNSVRIFENSVPNPPTSPIPLHTGYPKSSTSMQSSLNSQSFVFEMKGTTNNAVNCYSTAEKIRKLRTNFFDEELQPARNLEEPSSVDIRFEEISSTSGTLKRIITSATDGKFSLKGSTENIESQSLTNIADIKRCISTLNWESAFVHGIPKNTSVSADFGLGEVAEQSIVGAGKKSRRHSFHEAVIAKMTHSDNSDKNLQQTSTLSLSEIKPGTSSPALMELLQNKEENEAYNIPEKFISINNEKNNSHTSVVSLEISLNDTSDKLKRELCSPQDTFGLACIENGIVGNVYDSNLIS